MTEEKKRKGMLTLETLITIGGMLVGVTTFYFLGQATTDAKINDTAAAINQDITSVKERMSTQEANNKNLDAWLTRVEGKLDTVIAAEKKNAR